MIDRKPEEMKEYSNVVRLRHRGIEFFIATYGSHAVCEPIHEEVGKLLPEDENGLWNDSAHGWARGMSIDEQRARLAREAQEYIDDVISGESYRRMLEIEMDALTDKIERYHIQRDFFKAQEK